jgi:uncharacterized protein YqfB (UPF0267 family)
MTERFHGALAALAHESPFVAVRQREGDKLETLAKLCGCPVVDASSINFNLLTETHWDQIAARLPAIRLHCLQLVQRGEDALREALR